MTATVSRWTVRNWYADGEDVDVMARRLGVTPAEIEALIDAEPDRAALVAVRSGVPVSQVPKVGLPARPTPRVDAARRVAKWNHEEIIDCLRGWYAEFGQPMTCERYLALKADELPGKMSVIREFGSWNNAKMAAGIDDPLRRSRGGRNAVWTPAACRRLVREFLNTNVAPTLANFETWCQEPGSRRPAASYMLQMWGTWANTVIESQEDAVSS